MKKIICLTLTLVMMAALFAPGAFAADKTFVMGIDPEYALTLRSARPSAITSAGIWKSSASTGTRSWFSSTPWSATACGPA